MMSVRKMVRIDEEKCNGCGQCVPSCAEGALQIIDGKARLVGDVYCDGLGACLGDCPLGAITIEEREAEAYDERAVEQHLKRIGRAGPVHPHHAAPEHPAETHHRHHPGGGCPGSALRSLAPAAGAARPQTNASTAATSALGHWPVQLMLVPPYAPFLAGADLLVCADCVPFAVADFHARYLSGRAVVVGCPKLDDIGFYQQKLVSLLQAAAPASVTVLRMEVPCCGGIAQAVVDARDRALPGLPVEIHTVGIQGAISIRRLPGKGDPGR